MDRNSALGISIIVLLSLSIAPEAFPRVHASATTTPVSFSFQGTLISGTLTDNAIQVTSGSVTTDEVTYQLSTNTPPFTTPDLNQIHVSSSCGGLSTTDCLDATAIYLGNNVVMGWAAVYTVASSTSLAVRWGYTGPPAFPGSTAIVLGFDGQLLASINATGTLSINGSQVTASASGTAVIVSPLPTTNLIVNPGFENGLTGWSISSGTATYSGDSTTQRSGCCSAKGVEVNTGSLGRLYQDVTGITSPGSQYRISGWIKTNNVIGNVVIALDYVGTNPSLGWTPADGYVMEMGHVSGTQDWGFYQSPTFTLPPMPSDAVAAWFLFDFNAGAGTAWWDDVSLVCVTSCPTTQTTTLTVSASSGGTVSVQSSAINGGTAVLVATGQTQSWTVPLDTAVTLTATPDSDHSFTSWSLSSGVSNSSNGQPIDTSASTITALVSAAGQATANFSVAANIQRIKQFFPILNFSQGEKWLPTSFFFDGDANLLNNNDNYSPSTPPEHYVYIHEVSNDTHIGIQYWFYYTYNWYVAPLGIHVCIPVPPPPALPLGCVYVDDHLHDWDTTIFVILDKTTFSPVSVGFQYHGAITYIDWTHTCSASLTLACLHKRPGSDHIIVYVGEDGHGAYPTASDVTSLNSPGVHLPDWWTAGGVSLGPDNFSWVTVGIRSLTPLIGPDGYSWSRISHETIKIPGYGKGIDHPDQSVLVTNSSGSQSTCHCWPDRFLSPTLSIRNADPAPWRRSTSDLLWSEKGIWDQVMPPARSILAFIIHSPVNILVTDPAGRRTGSDPNGVLRQEIPNSEYTGPGTEPQMLFLSNTVNGTYVLTLSGTSNGSFNITVVTTAQSGLSSSSILGHVVKGEILSSQVTVGTVGGMPPHLFTSTYFTDGNNSLLPSDSNGYPKADAILSNGKVRSTNPGQLLAWMNVTNTGVTALQSLKLNETLPFDWTIHPTWLPAKGALSVFFELSNGTLVDITNSTTITTTNGNPETVYLSISNITATVARQPLGPSESILLSAKLSYSLIGSSQSFQSYPRNYTDTATASAWMRPFFTGGQSSASGSAFFTAHAKVPGDVDGDGVVNIIDVAMVVRAYGSSPGSPNWLPSADFGNDGYININDVSIVISNYGNHA